MANACLICDFAFVFQVSVGASAETIEEEVSLSCIYLWVYVFCARRYNNMHAGVT